MPAKRPGWGLTQAAINGAVVGPVIILLNAYFQGQLATIGIVDLSMMMLGAAFGGAILFLGIALLVRFLARRAG